MKHEAKRKSLNIVFDLRNNIWHSFVNLLLHVYILNSNYKTPLVLEFPKCGLPFCSFNFIGDITSFVQI